MVNPIFLKILPLAVIGGVAYFLFFKPVKDILHGWIIISSAVVDIPFSVYRVDRFLKDVHDTFTQKVCMSDNLDQFFKPRTWVSSFRRYERIKPEFRDIPA